VSGQRLPSDSVTDEADQERLLAEALRAQAVRAPMPDPARPEPQLLSGADLISGRAQEALAPPMGGIEQGTSRINSAWINSAWINPAWINPAWIDPRIPRTTQQAPPTSAWWIVLLAVLLGLAAGAVVGLVSIL
jgi:hypothetical protein